MIFHIRPHFHFEVHLPKSRGGKHDQLCSAVCLQVGLHQQRNLTKSNGVGYGGYGMHCGEPSKHFEFSVAPVLFSHRL